MKIVVFGATGHIGSRLAHLLLDAGHAVVAVGRSADKLADLAGKGAHLAIGDLEDAAFVTEVLADADRAFSLIPPNAGAADNLAYQALVSDNIIKALEANKIAQIVNLSSLGADKLDSKIGPIRGTGRHEIKLQALVGKNIVTLRPSYFFENSMGNIHSIQGQQTVYSPYNAEDKFPAIATSDIADKAFEVLNSSEWPTAAYTVLPLHGDRDYTAKEMGELMGKFLGVDTVNYVQIPVSAFKEALLGYGMGQSMVDLYGEMSEGMLEEGIFSSYTRTPENTTKTSYETWLQATLGK